MKLRGKTALITGGGRGIGRSIAFAFAAEGARVCVIARTEEEIRRVAQEIEEAYDTEATYVRCDVSSSAEVERACESALAQFESSIDILVNNAGIAGRSAPAWELELQDWLDVIAIDLTGVWLGCRAVLPGMIEHGYGRIVNISSIAGKEGNPNASPYSAAKAGVIGLTKSLAKEVATKGVIINGITPAVIATEILKQVSAEHVDYMTSRIPMGRVGQPEEVAALAAFLASSEVTFSTGAIFDLSGGRATY